MRSPPVERCLACEAVVSGGKIGTLPPFSFSQLCHPPAGINALDARRIG
jgi:hypothetical protein